MKTEKMDIDIVDLLIKNGYGVVEGKETILEKIDEMAENNEK